MGREDSQRKIKFWEKESFSFVLSLISVSIVFIFLGYLMGQYALQMLEQKSPTPSVSQQNAAINQEIETRLEQLSTTSVPAPVTTGAQPSGNSTNNTDTSSAHQTTTQVAEAQLYRVQVGAFSQRANAQRLVNSLRELGYEAMITDGPPYRVQTGAFTSSDNAHRYAGELESRGFEVTVVHP